MSENTARDENSKAWISGILETDLEFSHQVMLEHFYKGRVQVIRQSGTTDYVPIIVSEQLLVGVSPINLKGKHVEISGSIRAICKRNSNGISHLEMYLLATTFIVHSERSEIKPLDKNSIFLDGYICRQPVYRTTPLGRTITDFLLAVNRTHGRSSYIPCITWGRAALYVSNLQIGDRVQLYGRLQSREYTKILPDLTTETRTTYEVSARSIAKISK